MIYSLRPLFFLLVGLLGGVDVFAQHLLIAGEGDKNYVVVAAKELQPVVVKEGRQVSITPSFYSLIKGGDYLPVYIAMRDLHMGTSSLNLNDHEVNKAFSLSCTLETDCNLDGVYLAIQAVNDEKQRGVFLYEVGHLSSHVPKDIDVSVPMRLRNRDGVGRFFFFMGGHELFHSQMLFGQMEVALDEIVSAKIKNVVDAQPKPFTGPVPEYPKALMKEKLDGEATLEFKIDARGSISDPVVIAATRKEFGEAAMAVIRQWRFIPRVKDGYPVRVTAQMPFGFTAPQK